jgi:hypothetical protein
MHTFVDNRWTLGCHFVFVVLTMITFGELPGCIILLLENTNWYFLPAAVYSLYAVEHETFDVVVCVCVLMRCVLFCYWYSFGWFALMRRVSVFSDAVVRCCRWWLQNDWRSADDFEPSSLLFRFRFVFSRQNVASITYLTAYFVHDVLEMRRTGVVHSCIHAVLCGVINCFFLWPAHHVAYY